ncbi:hypothetical protein CU098_008288 [Rhizopus stolonifer]|uniref:BZIP domain-containing protein n=2 Tax=Mucorineae TaxID=1344963 RepID=A0A367KS97_RHIST|nr:hypothetical protein CU098_008288 [Rhizopus stolonifer]
MERRASAPSHPYHHPQRYPNASFFRSPPTSPEEKLFESSIPSSPSSSVSSLSPQRSSFRAQPYPSQQKQSMDDDDDDLDDMSQPPLTLQERRLRNKAASAKYRQKKNQQQNEMRLMIGRLSEQNAVLERQLQELRLENDRLKATTDKLRGKMVAKKMLKKWIGRQAAEINDNKKNLSFQQQRYNSRNTDVHQDDSSINHLPYTNYSTKSNSNDNNEHDDGLNAVVSNILDDQDEDDEIESISSD